MTLRKLAIDQNSSDSATMTLSGYLVYGELRRDSEGSGYKIYLDDHGNGEKTLVAEGIESADEALSMTRKALLKQAEDDGLDVSNLD